MALSVLSDVQVKSLASSVVANRIERVFPPVMYMELMLTADCNLRCSYCWVKGKRPRHMTADVLRQSLELLRRLSRNATQVGILFFGGEPLLRFDLIQQAVAETREVFAGTGKTVSFDITTNGTLLDPAVCAYLARHRIKYLLSLDGERGDHDAARITADGRGTFDRIFGQFAAMKAYQPWQGARVTVVPETAGRLPANVRGLHERGINQFIIGPAHGADWTPETIGRFEESMYDVFDYYTDCKKSGRHIRIVLYEQGSLEDMTQKYRGAWGCGAGRSRICVTPDGLLYGCSKLATILGVGRGLLPLGDVERGLTNWQSRRLLNDSSARLRSRCRTCDLASRCTGGCPATNYAETGNPYVPGDVSCAFAAAYDRVGRHARQRMEEEGLWSTAAPSCNALESAVEAPMENCEQPRSQGVNT